MDIKLPDTGAFECLNDSEPGFLISLTKKIELIVESTYKVKGGLPHNYSEAEKVSIDTLKYFVIKMLDCCETDMRSLSNCKTCLFSPDEVISYLEFKNYIKLPITISQDNKLESIDCSYDSNAMLELKNSDYDRSVNSVINYINYEISIDGKTINLDSLILNTMPSDGFGNFKIHIMDFDNIVNSSFYEAENEVKIEKGGIIYFIDNYSEESYIYIAYFF